MLAERAASQGLGRPRAGANRLSLLLRKAASRSVATQPIPAPVGFLERSRCLRHIEGVVVDHIPPAVRRRDLLAPAPRGSRPLCTPAHISKLASAAVTALTFRINRLTLPPREAMHGPEVEHQAEARTHAGGLERRHVAVDDRTSTPRPSVTPPRPARERRPAAHLQRARAARPRRRPPASAGLRRARRPTPGGRGRSC
ncbi:MAG: hypothetical protein QOK16_791 [Solirubrobacteraceae bacterium]|nr:hypothetical protein [Solirubrobacteraceae bacterium]